MASASSSSIVPQGGKYDVFISFRGKDTRQNIISHLHAAFCRQKVVAFIDDKLRRGDEVSGALLRTIEESKVSVIVFSKNYASSRSCLDELVKVLECGRRNGQIVVPVFYKVTPSDVRNQTGTFAEAFAKHERLSKQSLDNIRKWRDAMTEAANLSGWDSQVMRPEAVLTEKIVRDISEKLYYISSSDFDGLIGINSHIQHIESLLSNVTAEDVRILGIWGMGGIGKSTLAGAFVNQNFAQFEGHCFLANLREESQKHGLHNLRKELLAELLEDSNLSVNTPNLGLAFVRRRLRQKKVLIVLDDVSDSQQLEFLGGGHDWFGPGSIIIITSRDKQVLNSGGVDMIYEVRGLDRSEALALFRRHALKQTKNRVVGDDHHHDDMELSNRAINYGKGNPLALKVLGSFLFGRSKQEQQSALDKLERTPHVDIQRVLRVGFDGLDHEEQGIFLDIACFFKGQNIKEVRWLLDGCGFFTDIGIHVLVDKCLVVIQNETIQMHDLLQQMGREIVRLECINKPGERSRLWDHDDICRVLTNNAGTEAVKGIFLYLPKTRSVSLTSAAFKRMYNLKLLKIDAKVHLHEGLEYLPDELRYLHWDEYPLPSLPSRFHPENLVKLELWNSLTEQLWSGKQNLANLKEINLSSSENLISLPDLSLGTNLEFMHLYGCTSLIELPSSVQHLHKLKILGLEKCRSLGNLPSSICKLESLEALLLDWCSSITKFPEVPPNIKFLSLKETAVEEVPSSVQHLHKLCFLDLCRCKSLGNLPSSICKLESLGELRLNQCSSITKFPEVPPNINVLSLDETAIEEVPSSSIQFLTSLTVLGISRCKRLKNLPSSICKLKSLSYLHLTECSNLESFPEIMEKMEHLQEIDLTQTAIKEVAESLACNLPNLEYLDLSGSNIQNIPPAINQLTRLKTLHLCDCINLQSLPQLPMSIELMEAENCRSLEMVSTPFTSAAAAAAIRGGGREFLGEEGLHFSLIYFNFTNCFKLDQNAIKSIAADAELKFRITPRIFPYITFNILYSGSEVPDWFSHKSTGSSITIKLPPPSGWCNSGGFLGFAFCAVADFKGYANVSWDLYFRYNCNSKDKSGGFGNFDRGYYPSGCQTAEDDAMIVDSNLVLLGYGLPLKGGKEYCEGVDEISFEFYISVSSRNPCEVKMCGIHLLYDEGRLGFSEEEEDDEPAP